MAIPAGDANPFAELNRMLEQFRVPGLDMAPIIEARRKDIEALVAANKSAFESMQAVARKQAEILTETMQGLQSSVKVAASNMGAPDVVKQAELARNAYQKALADMTALAEMVRQSQADAMASITQRAAERLQEMQTLMQPKK